MFASLFLLALTTSTQPAVSTSPTSLVPHAQQAALQDRRQGRPHTGKPDRAPAGARGMLGRRHERRQFLRSEEGQRLVQEFRSRADTDGNGVLSNEERAQARHQAQEKLRAKVLERFDTDRDGKLSPAEREAIRQVVHAKRGKRRGR